MIVSMYKYRLEKNKQLCDSTDVCKRALVPRVSARLPFDGHI